MLRCPVCGSTTIYPVTGGVFGQVYRCKECGYRGSFVLETDEEGKEKGTKEDTGENKPREKDSGEVEPTNGK
jgi:transposase-like protein